MTWIVASPTHFGYAMGISDIQVSWGTTRHDCLRKIYAVAPFIVAGFAGSVQLGFKLLEDLTRFLSPLPEPGECWIPRWVALKWWRRARRVFKAASDPERRLGSSILLMGMRPTDDSGTLVGGRSDVIAFHSRSDFAPEYCELGKAKSIGSGRCVEAYTERLEHVQKDPISLMQAELGAKRGGMGSVWASLLFRTLLAHPEPGISHHIHYAIVNRGEILIRPFDQARLAVDGTRTEFVMPPVASGRKEFEKVAMRLGLPAAEATG